MRQWDAQQAAWDDARRALRARAVGISRVDDSTRPVAAGDIHTAVAAYCATSQRLTASELDAPKRRWWQTQRGISIAAGVIACVASAIGIAYTLSY